MQQVCLYSCSNYFFDSLSTLSPSVPLFICKRPNRKWACLLPSRIPRFLRFCLYLCLFLILSISSSFCLSLLLFDPFPFCLSLSLRLDLVVNSSYLVVSHQAHSIGSSLVSSYFRSPSYFLTVGMSSFIITRWSVCSCLSSCSRRSVCYCFTPSLLLVHRNWTGVSELPRL